MGRRFLPKDEAARLHAAAGEANRRRAAACRRIIDASRKQQGLGPEVADVVVLERVAAIMAMNGGGDAA